MSPVTHLFASWIVAAKTTDNARDCRLVALAGVAPDLDGLGMLVDLIARAFGHETFFWERFHHVLFHGIFGAALTAALFAFCAQDRVRVALFSLITFHLHLLCDLLGSRGPSPDDLWPILYFAPFLGKPVWLWSGQWRLDGWQNKVISVLLLIWVFRLAVIQGRSIVGIFSQKADAVFVQVIRSWWTNLTRNKGTA
jgi:inner membrane protein